jgi:hypothetical protein
MYQFSSSNAREKFNKLALGRHVFFSAALLGLVFISLSEQHRTDQREMGSALKSAELMETRQVFLSV